MKAVAPSQSIDFVIPDEMKLPKEEQTVFVITPLTVDQQQILDDNSGYTGEGGYYLTVGKSNLLALHMGLKEVRNLPDENGKDVVLERDPTRLKNSFPVVGRPWTTESLGKIPIEARDIVARKIKDGATLEKSELKNS